MFTELLERLARALDHAHLPYMVIGGQAVLLYGAPRLTRDIDITLGVDVDRQADVLGVATSLRITPLVDPQSFTRDTMVLPCLEPATGIRIDFIFSFTPYERQAIDRAAHISIGHARVRFATHIEKRLRELQSHEYDKPNLDIVKSIIWNLAKKRPRK